ncbi:MAG: biopolymer transporter ExbD [Cytophagaceae bacterium]|jgi:biopolymer transport protein ExbD|nr:biopolymer transporter ExbD [Cytophagaceae bacterium]
MSRFRKNQDNEVPQVSTASLPDIIFMLIFFFMVTTSMKEVSLMLSNTKPEATEVTKLERKSLVTYIYVGYPLAAYQNKYGSEARLQLNDAFATVDDIQSYIVQEREMMEEDTRPLMTVSIKADADCSMGIVTDVKQALRRAQALRISYTAREVERMSYK